MSPTSVPERAYAPARIPSILAVLIRVWSGIARRQWAAIAIVFAIVIIIRVGALRFKPIPPPFFQDEFSYILGAETFAKGRLANPPHPLAPFFETMQVNMTPTYASKYPPGQAGILALGIRLFGHPWYGVLLSVALMCSAICWALQGWVPSRWAFIGGVLAALEFALLHRWIESYWGGAVAATGGALVIGALPRLARAGKVSAACFGALGVAILLNSRPFEGLLVIVPCAGALLWWTRQGPRPWLRPRVILPALAILLANGAWLGFYNYRVTGSALTLPYTINQTRYAPTTAFWILPARPPTEFKYRDEAMARLWEWDSGFYWSARHNPLVVPARMIVACRELVDGSVGFFVLVLVVLSMGAARLRRWRMALCLCALFLAGMMCERHAFSHYLAPALAFVFIFASYGARLLYAARIGNQAIGRAWVACIGALVLASCASAWAPLLRGVPEPFTALTLKFRAESTLAAIPGQHVVLVRYAPDHDFHKELVYNGPDIDSQKVVWACDLGKERNRQLLTYYKGRTIWLAQPDPPNPTLTPYVESAK